MTAADSTDRVALNAMISHRREVYRNSFFRFFKDFWSVLEGEPMAVNFHIPYLCDKLQRIGEQIIGRQKKEFDATVVNISPGETKSIICTVFFPVWLWTLDAKLQILTVSHSPDIILALAVKSRDVINSKKFKQIFPEVRLRKDITAKGMYQTLQGGFRMSTTMQKGVTGFHFHIKIIDDPVKTQAAEQKASLRSIIKTYDQTLGSRNTNIDVTQTLLITQRTNRNDLSNHIVTNKDLKVDHICLPITDDYEIKPAFLRNFYTDGYMNPLRKGAKEAAKIEAATDRITYATQYGQSTKSQGGNIIRDGDVPRVKWAGLPLDFMYTKTNLYIDTAQKAGEDNDPTGIFATKQFRNKLYGVHYREGKWLFSSMREQVREVVDQFGDDKTTVYVEDKSNGSELVEWLCEQGINAELYKLPSGSKKARLMLVEPTIRAKRFLLVESEGDDWVKGFMEKLTDFPLSGLNDEPVDVTSMSIRNELILKNGKDYA